MTRFLVYSAICLLFSACSFTQHWQGSSTSELAQAEFKRLNGKQAFVLHVPSNDTYLTYRFNETDGELEASIKSASESVFNKKIDSLEANSVHLINQKGAEYQVILKGKQASGAFDVRFVSSTR